MGTTSPGAKFNVVGGDAYFDGGQTAIRLRNDGATQYRSDFSMNQATGLQINAYDDGGGAYIPIQFDGLVFRVYSGTAGNTLGLYQDTTGNVGIGSTAPGAKLEVVGNINSSTGALQTAGVTRIDNSGVGTLAAGTTIGGAAVAGLPAGSVLPYAGSTAPSGYLIADGSAVSRATYSALFTAISTTYGVGDGSTTFNVPDMRGGVGVGDDNMGGSAASRMTTAGSGVDGATLGAAGGAQNHTLTVAELAAHNHNIPFNTNPNDNTGSPYFIHNSKYNSNGSISSQGGGAAHNNTQPSLILNYIIKT
ncbi:MAG: tail fiber protein [Patescibacteria group bacterium]